MKKLITLFSIALAVSFSAQSQDLLNCIAGTATVDGYIDDGDPWGTTWNGQDSIKGASDMTSHFQIANDADKIYLVVEIADATPNNDAAAIPNSYERDCIEVFFSMKSSDFETIEYGSGDWQIRCQREAEETYIDGSGQVADALSQIEYAVVGDPNGYVIEMAFPIEMLKEDSDFDGENFRMDLATADNDGSGRVKQAFWAGNSDNQWKDTGVFGAAKLGTVSVKLNSAKTTISAYVKANDLVVKNAVGLISVYDVTGKLVLKADAQERINVASLKSGLYIVKNNDASVKVIK